MSTVCRHLMFVLGMLLFWAGVCVPQASADPKNLRQLPEGYWLSAEPTAEDAESLRAKGIELVVSLTLPDEATREALRAAGLRRTSAFFGKHFPDPERFDRLSDYDPDEILVHCLYGADRTGVVAAWLLVVHQGWAVDHALLAVTYPTARDLGRIEALLESHGHEVTDEELAEFGGIYSGVSMGGTGGLKILNEDYVVTVESMLEALPPELAAPVVEPTGPRTWAGRVAATLWRPCGLHALMAR